MRRIIRTEAPKLEVTLRLFRHESEFLAKCHTDARLQSREKLMKLQ